MPLPCASTLSSAFALCFHSEQCVSLCASTLNSAFALCVSTASAAQTLPLPGGPQVPDDGIRVTAVKAGTPPPVTPAQEPGQAEVELLAGKFAAAAAATSAGGAGGATERPPHCGVDGERWCEEEDVEEPSSWVVVGTCSRLGCNAPVR